MALSEVAAGPVMVLLGALSERGVPRGASTSAQAGDQVQVRARGRVRQAPSQAGGRSGREHDRRSPVVVHPNASHDDGAMVRPRAQARVRSLSTSPAQIPADAG